VAVCDIPGMDMRLMVEFRLSDQHAGSELDAGQLVQRARRRRQHDRNANGIRCDDWGALRDGLNRCFEVALVVIKVAQVG
jgi:hypothetical protein